MDIFFFSLRGVIQIVHYRRLHKWIVDSIPLPDGEFEERFTFSYFLYLISKYKRLGPHEPKLYITYSKNKNRKKNMREREMRKVQ